MYIPLSRIEAHLPTIISKHRIGKKQCFKSRLINLRIISLNKEKCLDNTQYWFVGETGSEICLRILNNHCECQIAIFNSLDTLKEIKKFLKWAKDEFEIKTDYDVKWYKADE